MNSALLIGAVSETRVSAVSGFFFSAGMARERLRRLIEEVRPTYNSESAINFVNSHHLPYLRACMEETLRIFLPLSKHRLTPLRVNQVAAMRNPDSFVDPESWYPEWWLPKTHPLYGPCKMGNPDATFPA
ncbi:hypothetical protein TruAng_002882 [Truncatella angustata]|nr:hypothetical protein TruAng_002882 [Truncatella angustata]